jgi:hypothetical protein
MVLAPETHTPGNMTFRYRSHILPAIHRRGVAWQRISERRLLVVEAVTVAAGVRPDDMMSASSDTRG